MAIFTPCSCATLARCLPVRDCHRVPLVVEHLQVVRRPGTGDPVRALVTGGAGGKARGGVDDGHLEERGKLHRLSENGIRLRGKRRVGAQRLVVAGEGADDRDRASSRPSGTPFAGSRFPEARPPGSGGFPDTLRCRSPRRISRQPRFDRGPSRTPMSWNRTENTPMRITSPLSDCLGGAVVSNARPRTLRSASHRGWPPARTRVSSCPSPAPSPRRGRTSR